MNVPSGTPPAAEQRRFRRMLRRALRGLGFDVIRYPNRRRKLGEALEHLRRMGVAPATIIDVGVADGTPELYRIFPDSRFLLVEPQEEYESALQQILAAVDGEYAIAAASSTAGTITLHIPEGNPEGASVLCEPDQRLSRREVQAVRIDDLVADRRLAPPFLVKADTQGSELEAMSGAEQTLHHTDAVVLEVSLFEFFEGSPQLAEVVAFMKERGFVTYDIVGGHDRPLDGALAQIDFVFVREDGFLRSESRYVAAADR
jgi:FkbM family methyltransferase